MREMAKLGAVAAAVLLAGGCGKQAQPAAGAAGNDGTEVVRIGQASPLTGPIAHLGKDVEQGARLAIDDINAAGVEIGGRKVRFELVSEDDQGDPKMGAQVAQRLVDAGVVGVIGHLNSGTTMPASRLYADAGLPQLSPSATNPDFTRQGFKTTYRLIANDVQQGIALGRFAVDVLKARTVAVVDDRTAYGQGLADEFEKAVRSQGATVVKREFTTNNATDFGAILTSIKAAQPDVVFYGGMDAQAGPMARQMKRLGIHARLLGGDSVQTPEFIRLAGDAADGVYSSACGVPRDRMPGFTDFNTRYKARFNTEVQVYSPYEYDAVHVLVDAMKRAGSTDPKVFLPEIAKTDYHGVTGRVAFDKQGDIRDGAVTFYQVRNGKWEVVSSVGGAKAT
ncbi:branched-chain amino acid ABC transporter substrate-binding protein [Microvirgula aerodenitrificans]|uniref:branched-chain amino acid ABC transporter substrate-binding protein n=1 Tax=Microvirgula aerodenitrificans TaxID=57480 RepID=UPI00248EF5C3|nr:branched-chain amino acid ABC transporter substrate-binding protein [Microvirgula aerodenitrificans]